MTPGGRPDASGGCPQCGGTGKVRMAMGGVVDGRHVADVASESEERKAFFVACPACRGTGRGGTVVTK